MLPDENTPELEQEATPAPAPEATPVIDGNQTEQGAEPNGSEETDSPTPEQIAAWRRDAERVAEMQAETTRKQQEAAREREERERYQRMAEAAFNREQQQVDPIFAIESQIDQSWDEGEKQRLRAQRNQLLIQRAKQEAVREAIQAMDVQRAIGDDDPNELARFRDGLSQADQIEMLRLMRAKKAGTLYSDLSREQKERERKAAEAQRLTQLMGDGASPGMVSGGADRGPKTINDVSFSLMSPDKKQEYLDAGYTVVSNRTGEPISR